MIKKENSLIMDSIDLARHLLAILEEKKIDMFSGNTKLNKLLYIIYGLYIAKTNTPILTEKPKCYPYGPLFPRVFTKYKKQELTPLKIIISDAVLNDAIDTTIEHFGNWTASGLSKWVCRAGSPWCKVYKDNDANYGKELKDKDIVKYFKNYVLDE